MIFTDDRRHNIKFSKTRSDTARYRTDPVYINYKPGRNQSHDQRTTLWGRVEHTRQTVVEAPPVGLSCGRWVARGSKRASGVACASAGMRAVRLAGREELVVAPRGRRERYSQIWE